MPSDKPPKTKSVPKSVSDFTVLTLTLPSVSLPEPIANAKHYLYIKPHETSYATANEERSLFISNIPIDANEGNIRTLFADQLGGARVEHVEFDSSVPGVPQVKRFKSGTAKSSEGGEKKGKKRKRDEEVVAEGVVEDEESTLPKIWGSELRKSGGTAVVVFVDRASMKGAWREVQRVIKEGADVMWIPGEGLGIERYKTHHALTYPSRTALQSSINAYLTQFSRAEAARNRIRAKLRSVPDEDGFVTVARPVRLERAEQKQAELEERKKAGRVGEDFYRFQTREKRKEAEGELKRKFEMDRRRVAEMRERRGRIRPES